MAIAEASQSHPQRMERPDRKAVEKSVAAASEEIKSLQGRIQEIKGLLEGSKGTKLWQSPELVEAKNKLSVMNAEFSDHLEQRRQIRAELDAAVERQREQSRTESRGGRERMSLEKIEGEIRRREYQMQHTSMGMREEKGLVQEIQGLKKSRDLLQQFAQEQALRWEKLREKDQLLSRMKVAIGEQKKENDVICERLSVKETSRMKESSTLATERNASYERIKALREGIDAQWSEFKKKQAEFFARENALREKRAIAARALEEKRYAEWQERERRKKDNFVEKFTEEIILCEQLEAYLHKLTPVETAEKISEVSSREEVPSVEGFGKVLMSKKNRYEEETWYAGKSKEKKGKSQVPRERKEKLCLSLDALSSFSKIGIAAPSSTAEVTKVLEDLKTRKEEFVKLQAEAKVEREKLEAEEERKQVIAQGTVRGAIENVSHETAVAAA